VAISGVDLASELDSVYEDIAPELLETSVLRTWPESLGRHREEIQDSGLFDVSDEWCFDWDQLTSARAYSELLQAHSDHSRCPLNFSELAGKIRVARGRRRIDPSSVPHTRHCREVAVNVASKTKQTRHDQSRLPSTERAVDPDVLSRSLRPTAHRTTRPYTAGVMRSRAE
jgi:hypothetical protein